MTQWGLDALFNPSKRHMDEEKRRLQATREEIGDASDGKRIDFGTGKVVIKRKTPTGSEAVESAAAGSEAVESAVAESEAVESEAVESAAAGSEAVESGAAGSAAVESDDTETPAAEPTDGAPD